MSAACHPSTKAKSVPFTLTPKVTVKLTPKVASLLALAAAHDRMSAEEFIAQAICRRVEEIGIANAVEWLEASP